MIRILGISGLYHDSAAALIVDGKVVAAAQEERFTRIKHDDAFPVRAVEYCLREGGVSIDEIDHVVFYDKPFLTFERLLETYRKTWPLGLFSFLKAMPLWLTKKLWLRGRFEKEIGWKKEVLFTEHHISHAASAYYASEFDEAVVVTMDGVGEWDTTTIGYGSGNQLSLTESIHFPDSLGLLYSAMTYYLGFKVNSAEYKVMGLAPYGNPETFMPQMRALLSIQEDGSFVLDTKYFAYEYGLKMITSEFEKLFGAPARNPKNALTQREMDIAAALQALTEEAVLAVAAHAAILHPSKNLCMAGGVALNCVANGKILESGLFENIYVQPAAGDAGGAVGCALYLYYTVLGHARQGSAMPSPYLGPEYSTKEITDFLDTQAPAIFAMPHISYSVLTDLELYTTVAKLLEGENVIGWFQGRMEFGPRALGNRSILGDARRKENWQTINLKIKFRESFRPFAPAVLAQRVQDYFKLLIPSPYMLLVAPVVSDDIPAVTHVDRSARVQTVTREQNERFYDLLEAFNSRTGCGVLINTSFNVRGEPIVENPEQALRCFAATEMDYLVLGNVLIAKTDNEALAQAALREKHLASFALD